MAKLKFNKKKYLLAILITAVLLVIATLLSIYLMGYRMVQYTTNDHGVIRFMGKVNKDNEPFEGNIYFSDGNTAKIVCANEITYANGDVYKGELDCLLPHGNGIITYAKGDSYEGEFKFGYPDGKGTYKYANGDSYTGDLKYGKKHGYGTYTWCADHEGKSDTYTGEYQDDLRWGEGTYTWADGSFYEGTYEADSKNGTGKITFSNGDTYEGDFEYDYRTGKGKYAWKNGEIYEGDFYRNCITGYGTLTWVSGSTRHDYTGYFENGIITPVDTGDDNSNETE